MRMIESNDELQDWQLAHIQKGVKAAQKGGFASDKEVKDFFEKYVENPIERNMKPKLGS